MMDRLEQFGQKLDAYLNKNRNYIIGYIFWGVGCGLAFVSLSAVIAFVPRFYGYFFNVTGNERLLYFLYRMLVVPAGIGFLGIFRTGSEIVRKNAEYRPDRIWNFYTLLFAAEFTVLLLAARI